MCAPSTNTVDIKINLVKNKQKKPASYTGLYFPNRTIHRILCGDCFTQRTEESRSINFITQYKEGKGREKIQGKITH